MTIIPLRRTGKNITAKVHPHGFPVSFTFEKGTHPIERIRKHWQVDTDWWSEEGRVYRDYFRVTTLAGMACDLYHDLEEDTWFIERIYD